MESPIIILGAGAAGLAAAKKLADLGRQIIIVEARNRIGGRIHTLRDPKLKIPIELGAEFIHGRPESTWRIVHQAGLHAFDLPFEHKRVRAGRVVEMPDMDKALAKVMGGLAHLGRRDQSFADYLRRYHAGGSQADARKFALSFVEGFDAADPERISAQSLAAEQKGIGDVDTETQFRLLDGYGSLIEYLHRSLDPRRVKLRLGLPVSEIRWDKSRVEICSPRLRKPIRGSRAIITLPLGVLQIPPQVVGSIRFVPDIAEWRKTAMGLAFGPVVKVILRFREAFWENDKSLRDTAFLHDPGGGIPTWWTLRPLRVPVLTAWAGGPKALALAGLSENQLLATAIESLAGLLNTSQRRLSGLLEAYNSHDWGSDPFSRGAYSYVVVGGMRARQKLSKPIENTLFFASEALDTTGQASTVAGALASGQAAAKMLGGLSP